MSLGRPGDVLLVWRRFAGEFVKPAVCSYVPPPPGGVTEGSPDRAVISVERCSQAGQDMCAARHEHGPVSVLSSSEEERDVVDRLVARVTDAGRWPHVLGVVVERARLDPGEHLAGLVAATLSDVALGLVLE